jgi:DNA polymerase-3 subunit delta
LVFGDDEYAVKERAKALYDQWTAEAGGMDHEIIDASASNSGEALKALSRLRAALQTLPFFGDAKVVWLKNCNFLGEERAANAQAVTEDLADLSNTLKTFAWDKVRLIISAGKIDKRKVFYKSLEKIAAVENLSGWSSSDKDWTDQAERWARLALSERQKEIAEDALGELVAMAGADKRQLENELEKLSLYVGDRSRITAEDVEAIVTQGKHARAFALGDALGDRDLPRALRCLDKELWELKTDSQKSEIGLLYGLISKTRAMILLKEMTLAGWIKPEADYNRFKAQLDRVPVEALPEDKRYNPLSQNPYVLFKALPQSKRYSQEELIQAMEALLECNQRLISSSLDASIILQRALVQIISRTAATPEPVARR